MPRKVKRTMRRMSPLEKRLTALGNTLHNASVEAHKLATLVADKEHDSAALQNYFASTGGAMDAATITAVQRAESVANRG